MGPELPWVLRLLVPGKDGAEKRDARMNSIYLQPWVIAPVGFYCLWFPECLRVLWLKVTESSLNWARARENECTQNLPCRNPPSGPQSPWCWQGSFGSAMMNSRQEPAGGQDAMQAADSQCRDFRSSLGSVSRTFHVMDEKLECHQSTMT